MRRLPPAVTLILALAACARGIGPQVTAIDLVRLSDRAEKRPPGARFEVAERPCGTATLAGLDVPVPSRLTYRLNFPGRARIVTIPVLQGDAGASAEFRIGISDRRTYETLATRTVATAECSSGSSAMTIDLSRYGGWQWSLFYRPDERTWDLIFGVTAISGRSEAAMWEGLRVETDTREARAFVARDR